MSELSFVEELPPIPLGGNGSRKLFVAELLQNPPYGRWAVYRRDLKGGIVSLDPKYPNVEWAQRKNPSVNGKDDGLYTIYARIKETQ